MATTENLHTGDGSKTKFSFTFPYLNQTDVEVYKYVTNAWVKQTVTTHYTFDNATTIKFGSAPAAATTAEQTNLGNTKNVKIKRNTSGDSLAATFYPGSAIRAGDLNDNYTQNLYVTQEASNAVTDANTDAAAALTTANDAETKADTAISTANTASTNATNAVSTANTASTNATTAVNTANTATTTANTAKTTAESAEAAVSSVLPYTIKANAAAVQTLFGGSDSPTVDDIFEMTATDDLPVKILSAAWASGTTYKVNDQRTNDSGKLYLCTVAGTSAGSGGPTGTGSSITDNTVTWKYIAATNGIWTISGVPDPLPTFSTGITVKLKYASGDASASSWSWQSYHANNPETRYAATASPAFTGTPTAPTAGSSTNTTQIATTAFVHGGYQPLDADLTSLSSCQSGGAAALAALTSTEIGIIDGATVSTAELNTLDGFTGDKDDLIYAKDLKATGVTTTEFDYLDGVTSSIQTQLDAKGVGDAVLASDQSWSGAQRGTINALTSAATVTIDFNAGNNYSITLGHNVAFANPTNQTAGQSGSIFLTQDGTGSRAPTWGTDWDWAGGTAPTLTTTASAVDRVDYIIAASTKIHAVATLDVK